MSKSAERRRSRRPSWRPSCPARARPVGRRPHGAAERARIRLRPGRRAPSATSRTRRPFEADGEPARARGPAPGAEQPQCRASTSRPRPQRPPESSNAEEFATGTLFLRSSPRPPVRFAQRETVALLTEQIAGSTSRRRTTFHLADWIPIEEQRAVIAHELTHALADQHFDLRRSRMAHGDSEPSWPRTRSSKARHGGHASVPLKENGLGVDLGALPISLTDVFKSSLGDGDGEHPVYARAPRVLKQSLQFPYAYGVGFVQALLREGSWKRVDRSYGAPPASTEQVMHPAKYLADERPVHVDLPEVSRLLGAGWRRADADVSGEFGYYLVLEATNGEADAARGAAGWAGDRYGFYVNDATKLVTYIHRSSWDSVEEAREFVNAYTKRLVKRFAIATDGGAGPDVQEWQTPEGIVRVERAGAEVLVLEGYRGKTVGPLVAALWNRRPPS